MTDLIQALNREFKDILFEIDSPPGPAREEMRKLEDGLAKERCLAQGKPLPTSLKPCFVPRSRIEYVEEVVVSLMDALEKVIDLYFGTEEHRALFEVGDAEKELLAAERAFPGRSVVFSRADTFMEGDSLKFLEFNCESPGGAYFTDVQVGFLAETEPIRLMQRKYPFSHEPLVPQVLETLLARYEEWGGARANPTIAVIGDPSSPMASELVLFGEYFNRQGFSGFNAAPSELEYDGNVLSRGGVPINIIYRRFAVSDLVADAAGTAALRAAVLDGNVCMVNPLRAGLGDSKSILGLLSDERVASVLDDKQREFIAKHIPWTRVLKEGRTTHLGLAVDLLEYVSANREKFVIKPARDHGGRGVVIGREAESKAWYSAIEKWKERTMVVQEYVPVPRDDYPVFSPDLGFEMKSVNHNFFVFDGEYAGGFARISGSSVINVSAGGGLVPFMIVEDD